MCGEVDVRYKDKGYGRTSLHCAEKLRAYERGKRASVKYKEYQKNYQTQWRLLNKANVSKMNRAQLLKAHGLTEEDYSKMVSDRYGLCDICKQKPSYNLYVDHCHSTLKIRGLLCRNCNSMVGFSEDEPQRLVSAAEYLRRSTG